MDLRDKLDLLGNAARYDDCMAGGIDVGLFAPAQESGRQSPDMYPYVSHVVAPSGRKTAILKVLQTSICQNNCRYCAFRAGRDQRRARFTPDELARGFDLLFRSGVVAGLFLSSGVAGTTRTMDEMLATVELVRLKYAFRGYVHLKLLPGTESAQVERAVELADRVSVNLEAPTSRSLSYLAPDKQLPQLLGPLGTAAEMIRKQQSAQYGHSRPSRRQDVVGRVRLGMSTQFVVGPAGESDSELLSRAQSLYSELALARAYYSAFHPVADTPLEGIVPTDPRRELRLYQADFLLRRYGFEASELPYDQGGSLLADVDPKKAWACAHPERFPVEVNRASYRELLRVPGVGPQTARAILAARRLSTLREIGDLKKLGARIGSSIPYVLLDGRRPPMQYSLPFSDSGELESHRS